MQNFAKHKKAISSVLSSIFSILLVICAVLIIYYYINNFTSKITNFSPNCYSLTNSEEIIKIEEAKYDEILEKLIITISNKNFNNEIKDIGILIDYGNGNTDYFKCDKCDTCSLLENGIVKTYFIDSNTKPSKISLKINNENCFVQEFILKN